MDFSQSQVLAEIATTRVSMERLICRNALELPSSIRTQTIAYLRKTHRAKLQRQQQQQLLQRPQQLLQHPQQLLPGPQQRRQHPQQRRQHPPQRQHPQQRLKRPTFARVPEIIPIPEAVLCTTSVPAATTL